MSTYLAFKIFPQIFVTLVLVEKTTGLIDWNLIYLQKVKVSVK
jgi:hypothetical protein